MCDSGGRRSHIAYPEKGILASNKVKLLVSKVSQHELLALVRGRSLSKLESIVTLDPTPGLW